MGGDAPQKHKLAGTIRAARESETFDLGGLGSSTIETAIQQAFEDPFEGLSENGGENGSGMIRITLVVGAGKLGRQKYDPSALRTVTATLQSVGFVEDRGASCVSDCAGLFKFQHDTGKNLKTVVVFPKLPRVGGSQKDSTLPASKSSTSLLPDGSILAKVAISSMSVFQNMVKFKTPSWSQKRNLLHLMDDELLAQVALCDNLLIQGQPLSNEQQEFYDSCKALDEKRAHVQAQMHQHVELGQLTVEELTFLQEQVQQKINEIVQEKAKPIPSKLQERQAKLQKIQLAEGDNLLPLQHHAALGKLWKQVAPLQHLDETSGKLLSVQETRLLGQKLELLEEIERLEQASQGWLEDDEIFRARVLACRQEHHTKFGIGRKGRGSKKGGSGTAATTRGGKGSTLTAHTRVQLPGSSKWVTPGASGSSGWKGGYGGTKLTKKKKGKMKKGDLFGAMMAASSSDEEDTVDDDDEETTQDETLDSQSIRQPLEVAPIASNPSPTKTGNTKTKTSKKSKKGGRKKASANNKDDEAALREAAAERKAERAAATKQKQKEQQRADEQPLILRVLIGVLALVQDYLIPAFLTLIAWLVTVFYGKPKQTKRKKH